jgi:signal transduction histidine kinase
MRRDFVANVSHELRTPITSIQSSLETLLEEGVDGGESRVFLEMALRNTRRMGSIIGNLLFLAGMESGADRDGGAEAEAAPLRPVIDEAVSLCRDEAEARRIVFDVACGEGLSAIMHPRLVVHALVNLVDNAVKYGPEGGVIGIAAGEEGDMVSITVSDAGPGIAPRHQSRVFERFYRVDGVGRLKKGAGLGLALAKHIALAEGGGIALRSEIGMGSAFTLLLPRG